MRKYKLLVFLLAVPLLLTVGCKKKDKNNPSPNEPTEKYYGTWNGTHQVLKIYMNGIVLDTEEETYEQGEFVLNIYNNNTFVITETDPDNPNDIYHDTVSYIKIDDYSLKFMLQEEDFEIEGVFKVNTSDHNKATIKASAEDVEYEEELPLVDMEIEVNFKR